MFFSSLFLAPIVLIVALVVASATVKIMHQYQAAVVVTLGRFDRVKAVPRSYR